MNRHSPCHVLVAARASLTAFAALALVSLAAVCALAQTSNSFQDLGSGFGASINDYQQVAGGITLPDGNDALWLWLPAPAYGLMAGAHTLGRLNAGTDAYSINNSGEIVGIDEEGSGINHAFL